MEKMRGARTMNVFRCRLCGNQIFNPTSMCA